MSGHTLSLYADAALVGTLRYDSRDEVFAFAYDEAWIRDPAAFPLSPRIRWDGPGATSAVMRRFVENLLPEGRALDVASAVLKVSRANIFGLIQGLGAETSGALALLAPGADPDAPTARRELTANELASRIAARPAEPFAVWDGRMRLSIAGYQDKLAVYAENERWYLVSGALASTHILKPEPLDGRIEMLVANEHYCMRLAASAGLDVAKTSILRVPDPVLVVRRFDRVPQPDRVRRLHIVDACQALDLPPAHKYERNLGSNADVRHVRDGVGFARLFSIARTDVADKAVALRALLRWSLFQFVIGNLDAHGKNVSFFCRPEGLAIAPFYDLASVVQYATLDDQFAMGFGDAFTLEDVTALELAQFAQDAGLPRVALTREMRRLSAAVRAHAVALADAPDYLGRERDFVRGIADFTLGQGARLNALASETQRVPGGWLR